MISMSTHSRSKINQLIRSWPKGVVGTQRWLDTLDINRFLAQQYCYSGWLERIGQGAYQKAGDKPGWTGAVYALQSQLKFKIHVGGQTALRLQGHRQYVTQDEVGPIWLFKSPNERRKLPRWFIHHFGNQYDIDCVTRALFDNDQLGLRSFAVDDYELVISTPERAILEYLNLAPNYFSLEQAQFLLESMMTLRPELLQSLLEHCRSIKTKRLFLVLSEHEKHPWWYDLNFEKLALGVSKLTIGKGGYYYPRYQLSLPIKLEIHEGYDEDDESIP